MSSDRRQKAIETFTENTDMTEREAEAYVLRELEGIHREQSAQMMDVDPSTLDTLHQRAKPKAKLPQIDIVKRVSATNTGSEEGQAWEIWFENGAMLRYVWNDAYDEIMETTTRADDPHSIHDELGVAGDEDELEAYALESVSEYTRNYRDDIEACKSDWTPVYEAITGYSA